MPTSADIIESARSYLGTPYRHQGRVKHLAIDCVGLLAAVARESGALEVDFESDYRRREGGARMLQILHDHLDRLPDLADVQAGDVLLLHRPPDYAHVCLVTALEPAWQVIEAIEPAVSEHFFDEAWREFIHSAWRIRGLTEA